MSNKKIRDLSIEKFGRIQPLYPTDKRKNKSVIWVCKCDCNEDVLLEIPAYYLTGGKKRSCGCLKRETDKQPKNNVVDETGHVYGHLTVVSREGSDKNGQAIWGCKCDCGNSNLIKVLGGNLRKGHTISCGCERRSHGEFAISNLLDKANIPYEMEKTMFKYSNGHIAKFDFFVNDSYLIEYDGETHYHYNLHGWHTKEQLQAQLERDVIKNQWCSENNIPLIRIPYYHLEELCIDDLLLEKTTFLIKS